MGVLDAPTDFDYRFYKMEEKGRPLIGPSCLAVAGSVRSMGKALLRRLFSGMTSRKLVETIEDHVATHGRTFIYHYLSSCDRAMIVSYSSLWQRAAGKRSNVRRGVPAGRHALCCIRRTHLQRNLTRYGLPLWVRNVRHFIE